MGWRPEATLDSGAFYVFNLTASNTLAWVKPAMRACAALLALAALHAGVGCFCMLSASVLLLDLHPSFHMQSHPGPGRLHAGLQQLIVKPT
jgi:hypothetical protein